MPDGIENGETCKKHSGVCIAMTDIQRTQDERRKELDDLWTTSKNKVPWFVFLPLLVCIFGMIGWQWRNSLQIQSDLLGEMSNLGSGQMVIGERISHMSETIVDLKARVKELHDDNKYHE